MKKNMIRIASLLLVLAGAIFPASLSAQNSKDTKLISDSKYAKAEFLKKDGLMKNLFDNSAGYVIFPNVGKGAIGVGGAAGNGIVFENGKEVGRASMKQVSVGF